MIRYLKDGISAEQAKAEDAQVRQTVEQILTDIETRGDAAVQELARKFDNWDQPTFRLSEEEIAAAVAELPEQTITDIKFAQEQICNFAQVQRDAMQDVEVETLPGVVLGQVLPEFQHWARHRRRYRDRHR